MGPDSKTLPVPEGLPNAHMRLFGGAQYHRAMAEFRASIGELTCPDIRCALNDKCPFGNAGFLPTLELVPSPGGDIRDSMFSQ